MLREGSELKTGSVKLAVQTRRAQVRLLMSQRDKLLALAVQSISKSLQQLRAYLGAAGAPFVSRLACAFNLLVL